MGEPLSGCSVHSLDILTQKAHPGQRPDGGNPRIGPAGTCWSPRRPILSPRLSGVTAEPLVDAMVLSDALVGPGRLFTGVRAVASTGSTNADLAAEARAGAPSGTVLIADHQSTGRGRFTRRWEASPGASVAVSVLLRAGDVPVARWPWLPLVTGVAVADGLRAAAGIEAAVKWPNDVLIDDRKVCGILAERVDDAAVIGMGINTTLTEDELPVATATSLALAGSQASTTE